MKNKDEYYMNIALNEAKKAFNNGEIPVGAVIVYNDKIVGIGHNCKEKNNNCLMHAEIIALNMACGKLKSWRLDQCVMYVNLEPCNMCMGAVLEAKIKRVVYSLPNKNKQMFELKNILFTSGILKNESAVIIQKFFQNLR